ncbi:hypothetical protein ACF0H5_003268 [Mactra antiquata]
MSSTHNLDKFQGYNNYKALPHRTPVVKSERLEELIADLVSSMGLPSMSDNRNKSLAQIMEDLVKIFHKYKEHLQRDNEAHKTQHHVRVHLNEADSSTIFIEPVDETNVKDDYKELNNVMKNT